MASPAVSTPSSAGSPAALAPQPPLAIKTNMSSLTAISSNGSSRTPTIMTSKEWVIPPRPKPGRKPATDTPPTKRKAQNRAAQRAFRERRAARVGELEEQLEETKEEQQRREADMRDKILRLEADVQRFSGELQSWRLRCDTLDRIADYERKEKEAALAELAYLRKGASTTGTDAVALPPRRPRHQDSRQQRQQTLQPHAQTSTTELPPGCGDCVSTGQCACADDAMAMATSGCGNCTAETHCQCLEDTIKNVDISNSMDLKRSHSPANEHLEKRQRHSDPTTPLEIDFTAQFSSKSSEHNQNTYAAPIASRPPGESCGFCEEGTYCMCAEAAAAAANETQNKMRLAPLLNEITPPPSDTDVDGAVKLPSMHPNQMHRPVERPSTNPCANGPGTCQQCQQDPKSGLFCRSLAAMRASSSAGGATPEGCCGGNAGGGGCCKTKPSASSSQPPSLSCAETYQTLSTHKNFEQASDELSTWLGRLHATPPAQAGRPPMEVEAASVMGVLKLFDRRFGRG